MEKKGRSISASLTIALISIPIFIGALDLTVVSAVLPQVIYDLQLPIQTKLDEAAWVVTGYLLAYSVAMSFMGRLSDIHGRRKVYLAALGVFALGSLMVAVSDGLLTHFGLRIYYLFTSVRPDLSEFKLIMLIISRMVQAFGGGAMVPVGMALVGDIYPAVKRGRALGVIAAIDTAGWVVGHLYGGIIVRYFDWRLIFWLNLPFCLIGFILIYFALRDIPQPKVQTRMDWVGAALISACLAALNVGLGSGSDVSLNSSQQSAPSTDFTALALALLFFIIFVWQQSRSSNPLIRLSLFRNKNFSSASVANFLVGAGLFIAIANVPLFINSVVAKSLQQGAWESGWMLSALTIPLALASFMGGWLTERLGYRLTSILGLLLAIAGFGLMSHWNVATTYAMMIPQLVLTGIGIGLTIAPIATAVVNAAPDDSRGIASALVLTFRLIGMTVGVSSVTTFGLRRADFLTSILITASMTMDQMVQKSLEILMQVIDETFLIAAAVCLLAIIPSIILSKDIERNKNEQ